MKQVWLSKSPLAAEFEWEWSAVWRIQERLYLSPCLPGCVWFFLFCFFRRLCVSVSACFSGKSSLMEGCPWMNNTLTQFLSHWLLSLFGGWRCGFSSCSATRSAPTFAISPTKKKKNLSEEASYPTFPFFADCAALLSSSLPLCLFVASKLWFVLRLDVRG